MVDHSLQGDSAGGAGVDRPLTEAGAGSDLAARARVLWHGLHAADVAALVALLALGAFYLHDLDSWLINDDEGSYLYAAWRISQGELPYRDFLTPQLPAFLLPGGALMWAVGPSVLAARVLAVLATLGAGLATWATARRLFGPSVALVAGAALLLQPDVFRECRTYRPEPFMLLLATIGVALFARAVFPRPRHADPPDRRWLAAAGVAFGLAVLAKLFGPLPLAGGLTWLAVDGWRRGRPLGGIVRDGLAVVVPAGLTVALGLGVFFVLSSAVYEAVLGHHLMQGAGLGPLAIVSKGLGFYGRYLRTEGAALLTFIALAVAGTAWRSDERRATLFAWQLPTALLFLGLSRELWPRHLIYLAPALTTLFALGVWRLAGAVRDTARAAPSGRWLAVALAAALLVPWWLTDRDTAWLWEDGTQRVADLIQLTTAKGDVVLSDYSELNFYARRPTTYAGASLSAGAARSGQITWDRLAGELAAMDQPIPPLLVVDRTPGGPGGEEYGHLRFLRDLDAFEAWVDRHYQLAGVIRRDLQRYRVYAPHAQPLPEQARFADGPTLLAAAPVEAVVRAGETLEVRGAWRAAGPTDVELVQTVRLIDRAGTEWAQGDGPLEASRQRTTEDWVAGELTADRVAVPVPPGTPPGTYDVTLGLYRRADLSRLEVVDAEGVPLGANVYVGQVRVRAPSDQPDAAALDGLSRRVDTSAADGLHLLGRGPLPDGPVEAGTAFPLELWWRAEELPPDAEVRVTLSAPDVGAVAADRMAPLGVPGTPPSAWPAGLTVRQPLRVPISGAAAAGRYTLSVVAVDGAGRRLPGAAPIELGAVEVAAREEEITRQPPPVARPLDAEVGDVAALVGADVAGRTSVGATLPVTLVWRANAPTAVPYKVTVQLLDADGQARVQHDSEPAEWTRPTTGWVADEIVVDPHLLELPSDLPPGRYTLVAALYHPTTLARLPASGPDAAGDVVRLGLVEVIGPNVQP